MPKGGLLHVHLDAAVNVEVLMRLVEQHPVFYVSVDEVLAEGTLSSTLPRFEVLPEGTRCQASLTDESYILGSWVPYLYARETFSLGGPKGFDTWVKASMTINPQEAYTTYNSSLKIWKKFSTVFGVSRNLLLYEPVFAGYVKEFLYASIADGISYVEPRIHFFFKTMRAANGRDTISHREWILIFERVLREVRDDLALQGRQNEFAGAKIIYTTRRRVDKQDMEWYLEDCLALKKEFPHLIAGFDMVGDENTGTPLIDFVEVLLRFKARQREEGVDIPYIFHAGETLGDGTHADMNLYDALLLGTKRIGHGFALAKHPELIRLCRERGIAIEVCPISNEVLRLTSSMLTHPLPAILNNGIPVVLSSDDPAAFGNMGLSYDFYQVFVASETNGLNTLYQLARDSLEFSTLEPEEKEHALAKWENQWAAFTQHIVELGL